MTQFGKWTKVEDELPPIVKCDPKDFLEYASDPVIVYNEKGEVLCLRLQYERCDRRYKWLSFWTYDYYIYNEYGTEPKIVAWMPMPKAPKIKDSNRKKENYND